jgi:hypothetical protein
MQKTIEGEVTNGEKTAQKQVESYLKYLKGGYRLFRAQQTRRLLDYIKGAIIFSERNRAKLGNVCCFLVLFLPRFLGLQSPFLFNLLQTRNHRLCPSDFRIHPSQIQIEAERSP